MKNWLLKHTMINELIKTLGIILFGLFGWVSWEAGKLASQEIITSDSYKLMVFGIVTGIMGTLALFLFTDVLTHLLKYRRGKNERQNLGI